MTWYDTFSNFYDRSLEATYRPFRERTFAHLELGAAGRVLDLACGTGQNLPFLAPRVGADGRVVALDLSPGMLERASERARAKGWTQVETCALDVRELDGPDVVGGAFDAVVCTLGLSVVSDWQAVLSASFDLLRPGGQYLVMDVYARRWNPMKPLVELLARADLRRDIAGELERLGVAFTSEAFEDASPWTFGGTLFVAHARRPA